MSLRERHLNLSHS